MALLQPTARQAVSFAFVGILNTAIDFAVFGSLVALSVWPVKANVAAWAASFAFSYIFNATVTFRTEMRLTNLASFFATSLVTLAISTSCVLLLSQFIGIWPAKIASIAASYILGFALARGFVFRPKA